MAHFLFNFTGGDAGRATALLEEGTWAIDDDERHRDVLSPGDVVLVYVAEPRKFIGRAEIATRVAEGLVSLSDVELWNPAVTMAAVVQRIDPTASNPYVQANAAIGFPMGLVEITENEYAAAVALSREARDP